VLLSELFYVGAPASYDRTCIFAWEQNAQFHFARLHHIAPILIHVHVVVVVLVVALVLKAASLLSLLLELIVLVGRV